MLAMVFADYKNTFKPAAADFSLVEGELEAGILEPETAESFEAGFKARFAGGRGSLEVAGFSMNFRNLVISQAINGLPSTAQRQRFLTKRTTASTARPFDVLASVHF